MKQKQIQTTTEALIAAETAIDGATRHEMALGLAHNSAAEIATERDSLLARRATREEARDALNEARRNRDAKFETARQFVVLTRDLLKPHLGSQHNERWLSAGFAHSLMVPRSPDKLLVLLGNMAEFLAQHPSWQHAGLNITAAHATQLQGELQLLHNEVKHCDVVARQAVLARDEAFRVLRRRISNLFKELSQVMSPLDPRWIDFGFHQPGAVAVPTAPEKLSAVRIPETAGALVRWKPSPRAKYYRLWRRGKAEDEAPVSVGKTDGVDFVLDQLPGTAEVEIFVTAVNDGGESARSEGVVIGDR